MRRSWVVLVVVIALLHARPLLGQDMPRVDYPPFDQAACVDKPQRILIIDMKSGWWSGAGGDFHDLLLPRIVRDCPNVEIEYYFLHYVEAGGGPAPGVPTGPIGFRSFYPERPGIANGELMVELRIPSRPWNDYHQVWLLSGGDQDPTDVPTGNELFRSLLAKYAAPAAAGQPAPSYFLGSGLGHRDHANHVLAALGFPQMFQSHVTELITPHFGDGSGVIVYSRSRVRTDLSAHPLFEGVVGIADRVEFDVTDCDTDFLPLANHPFQIVGKNRLGEPAIALRDTGSHRMVLDAGMQRFYSLIDPAERDTYRYLQNTIKWLAK